MGKGSKAPAPDYQAAAQAQGEANKETAQYNTGANRVNEYNPDYNVIWTTREGADLNNPQPGDYIRTVQYSPTAQAQNDKNNQINNYLLDLGQQQLGRVAANMGQEFDTSNLPGYYTSAGQIPMSSKGAGELQPYVRNTGGQQGMQPVARPGGGGAAGQAGNVNVAASIEALRQAMGQAGARQSQMGGGQDLASAAPSNPWAQAAAAAPGMTVSSGKPGQAPQVDPAAMQAMAKQQIPVR